MTQTERTDFIVTDWLNHSQAELKLNDQHRHADVMVSLILQGFGEMEKVSPIRYVFSNPEDAYFEVELVKNVDNIELRKVGGEYDEI